MKKSSLVLVIILVAASIIFTERKTDAWYSYGKPGDWPIHTALALLSLEKVMQSDEYKGIKWKQIFDVLIDGANAPDRHKKWLDHEATFRIENTLCASVKERKNLDALKRLAIGFHYLGDNGDATAGSYKKELAEIAYKMLFEDDDTYKDPKYKVRWGFRKGSRWRALKFNYDQIISQIDNVDGLVKALREMAKYRGRRLRNAYRQGNYYTVREEFMHTFAFIRACQNRLIDFYNEELKNGDSGECPSRETEVENRPDWYSECPGPGATELYTLVDPPPYSGLSLICKDRRGRKWLNPNGQGWRLIKTITEGAKRNADSHCYEGSTVTTAINPPNQTRERTYNGRLCPK